MTHALFPQRSSSQPCAGALPCRRRPDITHAADLPKLTLVLEWYPEPEHGGYFCAAAKGFWKAEGMDVEIVGGGPNAFCEKRVSIDENTLGICRGDAVLLAQERGLPVVAVNSYFQHDPQGIMVQENSPVKTLADLDGTDRRDGHRLHVHVVPGEEAPPRQHEDRARHGIGGAVCPGPELHPAGFPHRRAVLRAESGRQDARVLPINGSGFDPYRVIGANRKLLEKHPELVAAFSRGAYKGWMEYYRDPEPIHAVIKKGKPNMEDEGMRFAYREMRRLHYIEGEADKGDAFGKIDLARWDTLQKQMLEYGIMQKPVDLKAAVSEAFTPEKLGLKLELPPPAL